MEPVAIVTALLLIEYMVFTAFVGKARGDKNVPAPAVVGDPIFERYFRVQQNTIEQMVIAVPAMWLFAYYVNAEIAALLGLVFIVGRVLYFRAYVAAPEKRIVGMVTGFLANVVLVLGALVGALMAWF